MEMGINIYKWESSSGHSTTWLFLSTVSKSKWNLNVGICGGREENWRTQRNPQCKDEDQQQTQPSRDACLAIEPRPQ